MRWARFAVFILIATLLQESAVNIIAIKNITPDLLLIGLVFLSIYCDTSEAIVTSFTIGFCADLIGSTMGAYTLSFGLLGTLLAYMHRVIAVRKIPYQALVIFVTGLLAGIGVGLLGLVKGQSNAFGGFGHLGGTALYSSLIGPFLFLPSAWLMRIKTHRFSRH